MKNNFEFKLLVVDDEEEVTEVIAFHLLQAGILCDVVNDPIVALEKITSEKYAAMLSDIRMPKLDGLELLKKIRLLGHEHPVVYLTGNQDVEKMREAIKLGAFDFIAKPFIPKELIDVTSRAMEVARRQNRILSITDPIIKAKELAMIQTLKLKKSV